MTRAVTEDQIPTPRMVEGLRRLAAGETLAYDSSCVGRPTKQRLAKYGLAQYVTPKDWDGPMHLTDRGRAYLARRDGGGR